MHLLVCCLNKLRNARCNDKQNYLKKGFYNLLIFNTSTAFCCEMNRLWWSRRQITCNYTFLWINLKVKASLSSVLMLRLQLLSFFSMPACINFSSFQISKNLFCSTSRTFACHLPNVQTECEILLPLLLLGTPYESSIFVFFSLFFFYKKVKPKSNDHILLTTMDTYGCKEL